MPLIILTLPLALSDYDAHGYILIQSNTLLAELDTAGSAHLARLSTRGRDLGWALLQISWAPW